MSRRARIGFSVAGMVVFAFILFQLLFDSNWLRGPIGAAAPAKPGLAEDANCAALIAEGKARDAPVRTPSAADPAFPGSQGCVVSRMAR